MVRKRKGNGDHVDESNVTFFGGHTRFTAPTRLILRRFSPYLPQLLPLHCPRIVLHPQPVRRTSLGTPRVSPKHSQSDEYPNWLATNLSHQTSKTYRPFTLTGDCGGFCDHDGDKNLNDLETNNPSPCTTRSKHQIPSFP